MIEEPKCDFCGEKAVPPNEYSFTSSSERSFIRISWAGESLRDNHEGAPVPRSVYQNGWNAGAY